MNKEKLKMPKIKSEISSEEKHQKSLNKLIKVNEEARNVLYGLLEEFWQFKEENDSEKFVKYKLEDGTELFGFWSPPPKVGDVVKFTQANNDDNNDKFGNYVVIKVINSFALGTCAEHNWYHEHDRESRETEAIVRPDSNTRFVLMEKIVQKQKVI